MPTNPIQTVDGDNGICPPNFKLNPYTGYYIYCSGGEFTIPDSINAEVKLDCKAVITEKQKN